MSHLGAELLLNNDVFNSILPQHLFPPQPGGQGRSPDRRLPQLHRGDLCRLSKGHHGDDLSWPHLLVSDQEKAAAWSGKSDYKRDRDGD